MRWLATIGVALSLVVPTVALADPEFQIHGMTLSCRDKMDVATALVNADMPYFSEWSKQDFQNAEALNESCPLPLDFTTTNEKFSTNQLRQYLIEARESARVHREYIAQQQQKKIDKAWHEPHHSAGGGMVTCDDFTRVPETITGPTPLTGIPPEWVVKENADFAVSVAGSCGAVLSREQIASVQNRIMQIWTADSAFQQQTKQAAKEKEERAAKLAEARDQCEKSRDKQLYDAQEAVIDDLGQQEDGAADMAEERRLARIGGVTNLSARYAISQHVAAAQDDLADAWKTYKKLGGKASSPRKVTHALKDPCAPFEQTAAQ